LNSRKNSEPIMHKHILIPTDGSELSGKAVDYGMALAKSVNAQVTVLTVTAPFHVFAVEPSLITDTPEQYEKNAAAIAERHLNAARLSATAAGVTCKTMHVVHEQTYRAIIEIAAKNSCDLIVMASHGRRGVSVLLLGSETTKVLTHSTIPVLVVREPHYSPFNVAS
jgi:nucleotide-binding universal stress UspA family protein